MKPKVSVARNTVVKSEVLSLIKGSLAALSHNEIYHVLESVCNRVTIYRVLDRLVKEGYIHRIINVDGVMKYAACSVCVNQQHQHHRHVHFSCENCKTLVCLENNYPSFNLPRGYQVNEVNFLVVGFCPSCL